MEFELTDERRALREAARAFLEREASVAYARAMMDDERGWRDDAWRRMADLGWMELPFDTEAGGFTALSILLTEMGRVVLPGPYFSTVVLAGHAIAEAGTEAQRKELLGVIGSGELIASSTMSERESDVRARPDGDTFVLDGDASFVLDGAAAQRLVVDAATPDGKGLFITAEPASATPVDVMDRTRKIAHVRFEGTRAERLGEGDASRGIGRVLDRVWVGLAAEMLGGAERVVELAVDYAKQRTQFDRPIGSFQAVKHRAADMLLDVESLRNAVAYASWAVERDHPDATLAASMAKAYASDAYRRVAASGIQVHGGIGFTWEHDMHLYFKRAKASETAFGSADWHRERMAGLLERPYSAR